MCGLAALLILVVAVAAWILWCARIAACNDWLRVFDE